MVRRRCSFLRTSSVRLGFLVLAWLGAVDCLLLRSATTGGLKICGASPDCHGVLASRFSHLGPVPLSSLGMAFYCFMLFLSLVFFTGSLSPKMTRRLIQGTVILASCAALASAGLIGIQLFVLRSVCPLCMISAVLVFGLLAVSLKLKADKSVGGSFCEAALLAVMAVGSIVLVAVLPNYGNPSAILAVVDGHAIRDDELRAQMAPTLRPIETRLFETQSAWLEQQIARRIFSAAAEPNGMSVEQFVKERVDDQVKVTQSEIDAWLLARGMPPDKAQPALLEQARKETYGAARKLLYDQLLAGLRAKHQVEVRLKQPSYPTFHFEPSTRPLLGPKDAPVQLIVFSDFQCPYCAKLAPVLKEVHARFPVEVSIAFKHVAVAGHSLSQKAAEASECASLSGKFWEFHDSLFALGAKLEGADFVAIAKALGLESESFRRCLDSAQGRSAVTKDYAEADKLGIRGAPSLFLNGRQVGGFLEFQELVELVQAELATARAR